MKHNRTLRRGLSVLLSLLLCLSLLPAAALADEPAIATVTADFTTDVETALTLLGGADKAEWNSSTSTLTLKGVKAIFEVDAPTTYTITFDPNGGELITASHPSTETEPDGTVDYLAVATREGYTFDGWYTEPVGGEKVHTFITIFTADTTVYAHWTPEDQTKQITEASFAMKGYTVGADAEKIVITSNTEGLSLAGGYFEALGQPYSYLLGTDIDKNGEPQSLVTGPLEAGKEYILLLRADVDAGYDGSGLTKDAVTLNGTIKATDCGDNFDTTIGFGFLLPVLTADDTSPAKNTVTVNGSYASATGAGEYEEGDTVTLAAGSRSGYTFSGWTSEDITIPNAGSADTSFVMPAKNVTVTANWTEDVQIVNPFTDVPSGSYYEDAVIWAVSKGITSGTTETTFSPNAACTRAQAVTFLWRAAGSPAPESATMPFTDVAEGRYYYDAVLWAIEQGVSKGTSDTTFSPNATCTRAQIVTFLWRSQGSPAAGTPNPFTDVAPNAYYANAVLWAVEQGITKGTSATTFSPNSNCTRAQIVTFLYRCLG
ncbi:MAG: S-layer homology domain-containing protein [Candidatus Faecousia sp.]|nr:S-layer homology domain-containing protein [Candidatus Faecousia sp.]